MAGKKEKKKKKSKQSMSRIGSALFPRAIFTAVPRSPEPPKEAPEEKNPSALASALLNSTLVGRVIATPSPESTLRSTRHDEDEDGSSPVQVAGNASVANSMARSSMYDYDDSEEEEEEEEEEEDHLDDPYSTVPLRRQNDRNTISNRARLDTPPPDARVSDSDSMTGSEHEDDHVPHLDTSGSRETSPTSPKMRKTSDHIYLAPRTDMKILTNGRQTPEPKKTDVYAQPRKADKEPTRPGSSQSPSSSLTGVSSQIDDFSDLITPPPPWKRKKDKKKGNKSDRRTPVTEDRISPVSRMEESSSYRSPVVEPVIESMHVQSMEHAPPDVTDGIPPHPLQESHDYSQRPGTSTSHASNTEEDYLRLTNLRLEQELDLVQKERQQLLETLQQQTQTLGKLQSVQASLSPAHKTTSPTQGKKEIKQLQQSLQMKMRENELQEAEYSAKLDEVVKKCEKFRKENQVIREVNDQLHHENHSLKQLSTSIKDETGLSNRALQQQAEEVIEENEQLKNIIHKLNVQLSRYQAKCPPPQVRKLGK
ncbi:uncharacterized protein [Amphiura filiformis]|uniref:uncharacterized protein n=1 Tax=Amphiura filiformis TaxID=82378 RepID=UPI003B219C22